MNRLTALLRPLGRATVKFLRFAYTPNFQRTLAPMASSYYNFGLVLTEVFGSIGLIARAHPWRCGIVKARPLEVLSYACAKVDWRKPLALQTVVTGAIVLLLGCGFMTALTTGVSFTMGAGQAYAQSLFAPTNASTDFALKYMSNAFGVTIPGVPTATVDGLVGGFQRMMALYSTAMLIIAGFILLYILLGIIASTAHEGRFGGSGFNTVWAPIRLVVAIGLLVPLPMAAGYNGYNSGQYIVMKVAEWGSGLATNLWVPFATALANRGDVIATPNVPAAAQSVMGVLLNEFCMARYEGLRAEPLLGLAGEDPMEIKQVKNGATVTNYYRISGGSGDTNTYCGSTQYEKATDVDSLAMNVSNAYETAYNNMRTNVRNMAQVLNSPAYIEIVGSESPGMGKDAAIEQYLVTNFVTIVQNYQLELANAIVGSVPAQATKASDALTTQVSNAGWAGASMWFNTISRLNAELLAASRGLPVSSPPDLSKPGDTNGVPSLMSENIKEGIVVLQKKIDNIGAVLSNYGFTNMSGSVTVGGTTRVTTSSVIAGLKPPESSVFGDISGAVGSILSWVFSTWFGGPFGSIGTGAEAQLSTINPLAQLAQIGDWILNKSMILMGIAFAGSIGGGLLSKIPFIGEAIANVGMGMSIFLFMIAMVGFGAGITLFYITPLLPFVRFMFGVVGWLINILESVIAIPLVALAHLNTSGGGITGDMARKAYFLVLSIFLRPALLIVGLVVSLMMFMVSVGILNDMYKTAILGFMGTSTGNAGGGLSVIMYTVMYVGLAYGLANMCFKLIEEIPNHAMNWIGQASAREVTQDESFVRAMSGAQHDFVAITNNIASRRTAVLNSKLSQLKK